MNLIHIRGQISHPFKWEYFKNLGNINGRLGKHLFWELEHSFYSKSIVDFELRWSIREDHAGFNIEFGLLGYGIHFFIYDSRHWEETNGKSNS